jgi:hypothetical protein
MRRFPRYRLSFSYMTEACAKESGGRQTIRCGGAWFRGPLPSLQNMASLLRLAARARGTGKYTEPGEDLTSTALGVVQILLDMVGSVTSGNFSKWQLNLRIGRNRNIHIRVSHYPRNFSAESLLLPKASIPAPQHSEFTAI